MAEKTLTTLEQLELLAQRTKKEANALSSRIEEIVSTGGEPNVITSIKVNGAVQPIDSKTVDITVPTDLGDLSNTPGYQKAADVTNAVTAAINKFAEDISEDGVVNTFKELVDYVADHDGDAAQMAADILKNAGDIEALQETVADKVDQIPGKQLSTEDFTTTLKDKLEGLNNYTHPTAEAHDSGLYKITVDGHGHVTGAVKVVKGDITALNIPGQDTTYEAVIAGGAPGLMTGADKTKLDGLVIAENSEVTAMLDSVFGT